MSQLNIFKRMTRKKAVVLLATCLVLVLAAVGGTVAYLITRTDPVENTFVPVVVDSAPVQTGSSVAVQNNGEVTAFLRAAVVFDWVVLDEDGNPTTTHYSYEPVRNADYVISYDTSGSWVKGSDGYWYYTKAVAAGNSTPALITSYERVGVKHPGYQLSMKVITSGIQADPESVVGEVWGATASGGVLTPK